MKPKNNWTVSGSRHTMPSPRTIKDVAEYIIPPVRLLAMREVLASRGDFTDGRVKNVFTRRMELLKVEFAKRSSREE